VVVDLSDPELDAEIRRPTMAYIYHIDFDIRPDQMDQLRIGAALERVLGYLRTLLPSETGYITARAMYSVDRDDRTHLVFQSVWETWEDLEAHRESELAEDKVLTEFEPHVELNDLVVHVYEEVA
jgi:quinol monooxygenase YgiN